MKLWIQTQTDPIIQSFENQEEVRQIALPNCEISADKSESGFPHGVNKILPALPSNLQYLPPLAEVKKPGFTGFVAKQVLNKTSHGRKEKKPLQFGQTHFWQDMIPF